MNDFNIDKNTMDKLNSMLNNGNLNDMISQIPPDALKNFSNMMNPNNASTPTPPNVSSQESNNNSTSSSTSNSDSRTNSSNFDFNNIDINTMMKMKNIIEKMNNSSDPRSNLLQSLKPYLRNEKKDKLDQYSKILNMTNLMELFNQNNNNGEKTK